MSRFVDHKSGVTRRILALGIFSLALGLTACSGGGGPETAGKSPSGDSAQPVAEQSPALEGSGYNAERQGQTAQKMAQGAPAVPEGSESAAGKGDKDLNHPSVAPQEVLEREVFVPESIQGRWKAVKIRIRDKRDPNQTQVHTVELGQGFPLGDTGMTVNVGPFFPNFVMNSKQYSSMDNRLLNPAVQLVVEREGEIIYKGWAFEKFPDLYSFEHKDYQLQLVGYVKAETS